MRAVLTRPVVEAIKELKVDQVKPDEALASEVEEALLKGWRKFVFGE